MSLGRCCLFFSLLSQFSTNIQTWKSHFALLFLFPWLGWATVDAGCHCGQDEEYRWMELSSSIQHSCPQVTKGLCGDSPVKRKVLQGNLPEPQKMQQTQLLGEASTFLPVGCWGARHQIAFWVFVVVCFVFWFFFSCFVTNSSVTLKIQFQTVPRIPHPQDQEGRNQTQGFTRIVVQWNGSTKMLLNACSFLVQKNADEASVRPAWWSPGA